MGFTPCLAQDGVQALAAAQAYTHELAGALLDVRMPGTNGVDAAEAIHQLLPDLPLILMSGSVPAHLAHRVAQLPLAGFLEKPFTLAELRTLLAQAFPGDQPPEGPRTP